MKTAFRWTTCAAVVIAQSLSAGCGTAVQSDRLTAAPSVVDQARTIGDDAHASTAVHSEALVVITTGRGTVRAPAAADPPLKPTAKPKKTSPSKEHADTNPQVRGQSIDGFFKQHDKPVVRIRYLQRLLKVVADSKLSVDGRFGSATKKALKHALGIKGSFVPDPSIGVFKELCERYLPQCIAMLLADASEAATGVLKGAERFD